MFEEEHNYLKNHKKTIIGIIISLLIIGIIVSFIFIKKYDAAEEIDTTVAESKSENKKEDENKDDNEKEVKKIKVDIKGAITSPGVYEIDEGTIVNELINMAGGITKNATTKNINLSRKLADEMVVIIYTQTELESKEETDSKISGDCNESSVDISSCYKEKKSIVNPNSSSKQSESSNTKNEESEDSITYPISLNTATLEELMSLSGIGEAKAQSIINYRQENGNFNSIEEVMNVKGIGEALFNKIKDNITV